MAGEILSSGLGQALKITYSPDRVVQLENIEAPYLAIIDDSKDHTVGGTSFNFAVDTKDDQSFGYQNENAQLPAARLGVIRQASVTPVVFAGQTTFSGLAKAIATLNAHAFTAQIARAADQKLKNMTSYKEAALFRDGKALLGLTNGAGAAAAIVTLDSCHGFRRGQFVDVIDPANNKDVNNIEIVDVNFPNNTFTFASNQTWDDNSAIYPAGKQTTFAGTAFEINGLRNLTGTSGTYLGIDRATYYAWKGEEIDASGAALTEDLLLRAEGRPLVVGGVSRSAIKDFRLVWHPNQRRQYFKLAIVQRQFTGRDVDLSPGRLMWNGHEAIETFNMPETELYIGDHSQHQRFVAPGGEMKLDDTFGNVIKWTPDYDMGAMYWRSYENYGGKKPNALVRVYGLQNVSTR